MTEEQFEALRPHEVLLEKLFKNKYLTKEERNFPSVIVDTYQDIYSKTNTGVYKVRKGCNSCGTSQWAKRLAILYFKYKKNGKLN